VTIYIIKFFRKFVNEIATYKSEKASKCILFEQEFSYLYT